MKLAKKSTAGTINANTSEHPSFYIRPLRKLTFSAREIIGESEHKT